MPRVKTTKQMDLFARGPTEFAAASNAAVKLPQFCTMCHSTYLSDHEVAKRYGVSRAAIWRWVDAVPEFPRPIKLSPGTTRWKLSDLVQFEAQRERCGPKP